MKKVNRFCLYGYLVWAVTICFLNLSGNIGFGHGIGDLYYLGALFFCSLIVVMFFLLISKSKQFTKQLNLYFLVYLIIIIIFYTLKLTFLRGAEYPWDGSLFL
jgi:hypothetical protein